MNFDDLCPSDILSGTEQECMTTSGKSTMRKFQICGREVPRGNWVGLSQVLLSVVCKLFLVTAWCDIIMN